MAATPQSRGLRVRIWSEISIVLLLSLGSSALYSIVAIIYRLTAETSLNQQTATINRPLSDRAIFDLVYQFMSIALGLMPVALVLYLLWTRLNNTGIRNGSIIVSDSESVTGVEGQNPFSQIGLTFQKFWHDFGLGIALCAAIGIPGLALYLGGKALNLTVTIVPTTLDAHWWTVPVLILLALKAALLEEVILIGYLFTRLRQLSWGPWAIIISTTVLRGAYHLYQGIGPGIGNIAMGLVFGWVYHRWGRVMPLVIAHFIIDIVSFVGYPLAVSLWPELFGLVT